LALKPGLGYRLFHFLWGGLDFFFPPSCGGCGKLGVRWCTDCRQKLASVPLPICEICGEQQQKNGICNKCLSTRPAFYMLRSCFIYKEPVRPALIRLKYYREVGLGEALAWDAALYLDNLGWQADFILPIPLSEQRIAERGYNQVDLITHPLARIVGWKYAPNALRRIRHTNSQVGLNVDARRKNVFGVFEADVRLVTGKIILLMDDVATTGSTLESASNALMEAGASKVYALTFARAMPKFGLDFYNKSIPSRSLR
jgi:ComF family protein